MIHPMNRKKIFYLGFVILLTSLIVYLVFANKRSGELQFNSMVNGIVPDEATAIKVAEAISLPVFGKNINDYKPFHASLINDTIWHVYGLPKKKLFSIQVGGAPEFDIQKKDGKVMKVILSR